MNEENFDKILKIISKHTKEKECISNETSSETIEGWDSYYINIIVDMKKNLMLKLKLQKLKNLILLSLLMNLKK